MTEYDDDIMNQLRDRQQKNYRVLKAIVLIATTIGLAMCILCN